MKRSPTKPKPKPRLKRLSADEVELAREIFISYMSGPGIELPRNEIIFEAVEAARDFYKEIEKYEKGKLNHVYVAKPLATLQPVGGPGFKRLGRTIRTQRSMG